MYLKDVVGCSVHYIKHVEDIMQRQAFVNAIMNLLVPNTVPAEWQFRKDYVHVTQLIKMLSNHFVRKWN
jgi:hypothetical protein